MKRKVRLY